MNQRIIYPTDDGGVAIIIPAPECELTIEKIALKDVPAETPYLIVDVSDIPFDREFRNAWESDFSTPDGYGIGADAWFAEQEAKKLEAENDNNQPE
jgi:hypothetical protein